MIKKLLIFLILVFALTGCTNLNNQIELAKKTEDNNLELKKTNQELITQVSKHKSILDYYLDLPNDILFPYGFSPNFKTANEITRQDKIDLIEILDEKNYYIKIKKPTGAMPQIRELTVFTSKNKNLLMYTGSGHWDSEYFFEYINDKLVDVTEEVWGKIKQQVYSEESKNKMLKMGLIEKGGPIILDFVVPRYGTDILVGSKFKEIYIYKIKWENAEFTLKEY